MVDSDISERAAVLLRDALVWDMVYPWEHTEAKKASLATRTAAGYDCVSLTIALDRDTPREALHNLARMRALIRADAEMYLLVETVDDVLRAKREGKLALCFHFQGTNPIEYDVDLVEVYYKLGVRHMLMAYNLRNAVADGCKERTDSGLSSLGVRLIEEMNRVGMIVDCSHTGYRATMDAFELSKAPVVFSHTAAHTVWEHHRNVRDEQIRACARSGGVMGICGVGIFLGDNDNSAEAVVRHVDYISELVGPGHVGIGFDFVPDPSPTPSLWNPQFQSTAWGDIKHVEPEQLPEIVEVMLRRGYSEADIRGFLGENWLRVARQVWK